MRHRDLNVGIVAILLLSSCIVNRAGSQEMQYKVFVALSGNDVVGQQLSYEIREELRRSETYDVSTERDALFTINVVSLDLALPGEQSGASSAVAVSYTMKNLLPLEAGNPQTWYRIHLSTSVFLVGRNRVETQAKSIVATLDQDIENYLAEATR